MFGSKKAFHDGAAQRSKARTVFSVSTSLSFMFLAAQAGSVAMAQDDVSWTAGCDALTCLDLRNCSDNVHWISLPAYSGIDSAEELFDFVPGASRVSKRFPHDGGAESYSWDGTTCTLPNGDIGIEPGAELCQSACFCVEPGEGFEVVSNDPRRINIFGDDADTEVMLRMNQIYLISLPQNSFVKKASMLLGLLPDGSRVSRRNCDGTLTTYFEGSPPSANFDVRPGEAYEVIPGTDGPALLSEGGVAPTPCEGYRYEIHGESQEVRYSWGVESNPDTPGFEAENLSAPPVTPFGAGPFRLAEALAEDINLQHGVGVTADADLSRPEEGWLCVASEDESPQLFVGVAEQPAECNANVETCTYNPTIHLGTVPVSTLTVHPGEFSWTPIGASYDLLWGRLSLLRELRGDFTPTVERCLADDLPDTRWPDESGNPDIGTAFWYLVRVNDDRGARSYDSRRPGQLRPRDRSINTAPTSCLP